jgi:hypothetical protein
VPPLVDGGDVVVGPAEVVGEFVDRDVGDEVGDGDVAALGPFVEDGRRKSQTVSGLSATSQLDFSVMGTPS